jgi:hypothetical protein
MKLSELQGRRYRRNSITETLFWRILSVCAAVVLAATCSVRSADAAPARAWFWLSSDQIRALRDVSPAPVLVFNWSRHNDVIPPAAGEGTPVQYPHPDSRGTLVLGADYIVMQETGGPTKIYDFRLDRLFQLQQGESEFENTDLLELMYLRDEETFNRRVQGKIFEVVGQPLALGIQPYYEAELGTRARTLPPIKVTLSTANGARVATYNGEILAAFKDGTSPLTPQQAEMFAKALRYFEYIHPAAVDAITPLHNALSEATGVYSDGGEKLRTTVTFDSPSAEQRPYPLPAGLRGKVHAEGSNAAYVNRLIDIGLNAASGAAGPKPTREDYVADEARAYAAGDLLGTGLASIALTTHFPDEPALCQTANAPPRCQREPADFQAALRDSSFHRVVEAVEACSNQPEKAAQLLSSVDISGKKHGYMANYQMYCALRQISSERARQLVGLLFEPSAPQNMIRALTANPFIPAFYFDAGMGLVGGWDASGWRLIEIGEALGGGTAKGDAYDKDFSRLKQDIMSRYPERF